MTNSEKKILIIEDDPAKLAKARRGAGTRKVAS